MKGQLLRTLEDQPTSPALIIQHPSIPDTPAYQVQVISARRRPRIALPKEEQHTCCRQLSTAPAHSRRAHENPEGRENALPTSLLHSTEAWGTGAVLVVSVRWRCVPLLMPMQREHDKNTVPGRRPSLYIARGRIWRVVTVAINHGHLPGYVLPPYSRCII